MKEIRRKIARRLSDRPLTLLVYALLRFIHASMRITVAGRDVLPDFVRRGEAFIGISWHGRLLMLPFLYPGKELHVLISVHRDGEIIANIVKRFGFSAVRGSSSKGGKEALNEMVRLGNENKDLAITPDGPRGPAEIVKPGVAKLARLTGKAVVPVAFASSRCKRLKSWDRFLIPYPFSRGAFVTGEPLYYREGEEMEAFRLRIEDALRSVTDRADAMVA
jgi:lysophospholipid acyltransferase (LPLAT)-like uncharacterized protein